MTDDPLLISRAILIWTGKGRNMWPPPHDELIVEEFRSDEAALLLPIVRKLKDDFFASDAWTTVTGNKEMVGVAAEEFRQRHPEITEEAVQALANSYAFSYR